MGLVHHDMILVAVVWYGNIHAAFGRTLFLSGVFYRPACACIFLRALSGLSRISKGRLASLDPGHLTPGQSLFRCTDQAGVHKLAPTIDLWAARQPEAMI